MNIPALAQTALAYGEVLWDILPDHAALGGAPANFAYRLSTLGIATKIASRVGNDELGQKALQELLKRGCDTSLIQKGSDLPTGTVDVALSSEGNPSYTINPNTAYDMIELSPELSSYGASSALICFGTLIQRSKQSRNTLYSLLDTSKIATKFLDINLRTGCFTKETVGESLKRADILKLNESEKLVISEMFSIKANSTSTFCQEISDMFNLKACVVTLGANGSFGYTRVGDKAFNPGYTVEVVDTIGAGDSFAAGFAVGWMGQCQLQDCLEMGNRLGALAAKTSGAMSPFLDDAENLEISEPNPEVLRMVFGK